MKEILLAGFGGQGVLTGGLVLSQIMLFKGWNATWMPSYGASMRGGTANCTVHYGAEEISNPGLQQPDLLLAMNTPSYVKFESLVRPGGTILVNSDMVELPETVRGDVRHVSLACNHMAMQIDNARGANIVMVGAIIALLRDCSYEEGEAGMNDMFRKKGKSKFESANMRALSAGYKAIHST